MKNSRKQFFSRTISLVLSALLLSAVLMLPLASCGPDDPVPGSAGDRETQGESHEAPEESSTPAEQTESGGDFDMTESSPATTDVEHLLEMVRRTGQDMPEEFFWIDRETVEVLGFNLVSGVCRDGLASFDCTLTDQLSDGELAPLYGLTEEELGEGQMRWRILARNLTLTVTLRPQDEPPETWTAPGPPEDYQPPEWKPLTGDPNIEMAVVEELPNGQPLSACLRWQEDSFWFLAQVSGHMLDDVAPYARLLWRKVKMAAPEPASLVEPMPEPEDGLTVDMDQLHFNDGESGVPLFSSVGAYSWNGALLREEIQGFGEIWWFNDDPVTEMYGEEVFADGVCHDGVCSFEFYDRREPEELAALYGLTGQELQRTCMDEWPWENWYNLVSRWRFHVTIQPMTGEGFDLWAGPEKGSYEEYEDYLRDSISRNQSYSMEEPKIDLIEMYHAGEYGPKNAQPASEYQYPVFRPVEGYEGLEMAVTARTPADQPLQVRFQWRTEDGFGCWATVPGWAIDRFYQYFDQWFIRVDTGEAAE